MCKYTKEHKLHQDCPDMEWTYDVLQSMSLLQISFEKCYGYLSNFNIFQFWIILLISVKQQILASKHSSEKNQGADAILKTL